MRLDTFLRNTALISRKDIIHYLCEEGSIRVNGIPRRGLFDLSGEKPLSSLCSMINTKCVSLLFQHAKLHLRISGLIWKSSKKKSTQ